jgi:hypothetical protein
MSDPSILPSFICSDNTISDVWSFTPSPVASPFLQPNLAFSTLIWHAVHTATLSTLCLTLRYWQHTHHSDAPCTPPSTYAIDITDLFTFKMYSLWYGARGSVVGWGTVLQAGRSRVRFPITSLDFFLNLRNISSRTMALGSTQPLTEMTIRNLTWG